MRDQLKRGRQLPRIWPINGIAEEDRLLTTHEAAWFLRVSPATLKYWRVRGRRAGPNFIRLGGRVRYSLKHLRCYISERTVRVARRRRAGP